MKRILSMILSISMIAGILVTPAFAAPIDKITADDAFMAIFNPGNAVDRGYEPGQKAAVAIPSNSHYADYASEGFWFVWGGDKDLGSLVSAKQKDTGFAVLANFFFDKYESLTITVKSSNEYRNVTFTEPGTYFIDQFLLKNEKKGAAGGYHNINWIGVSMTEKPDEPPIRKGTISIEKWVDGQNIMAWATDFDGDIDELIDDMTFTLYPVNGPDDEIDFAGVSYPGELSVFGDISFPEVDPGWYAIVEDLGVLAADVFELAEPLYVEVFEGNYNYTPEETISIVSGSEYGTIVSHNGTGVEYILPDVWNDQLTGQSAFDKLVELGAQWIWDTEDTYEYGVSGNVFETRFPVNVDEAVKANFYFAADNAAVVYVNGKLAGYTSTALKDSLTVGEDYDSEVFGFLEEANFDGRWSEGWTHAYEIEIDLLAGENDITVVAANSRRTENTGTPNDSYDTTNNPCGLIFACTFTTEGAVFENKTKGTPKRYATVSFDKKVLELNETGLRSADPEEFTFDLYMYNEETSNYEFYGTYLTETFGTVSVERLEVGKYYFKEVDATDYVLLADLYFDVVLEKDGKTTKVVWDVEPEGDDKIVINKALGALEATANVTATRETTYYKQEWLTESIKDTLVSGGAVVAGSMGNSGQTFIGINVAEASTEAGVDVEIAYSTKPNPTGIGLYYNVKIVDKQIVVSVKDASIVSYNVGIQSFATYEEAAARGPGKPGGKDANMAVGTLAYGDALSVPLLGNGNVAYLYVHADSMTYYTGEFEWVYDYSETVDADYEGELTLDITCPNGFFRSCSINNGETVPFSGLESGEYICVLSGDGFENQKETVNIEDSKTTNVTFNVAVTYSNDVNVPDQISPIATTFSAPLASGYSFVPFVNIVEEPVPLAVITTDNEPDTEETETVETETVEDDEEAVSEETKAIIPEADETFDVEAPESE